MNDYRYAAVLTDDPDGGVIATFPDVPEAITFGRDEADAVVQAAEALGLALRSYLAGGRRLPLPATGGAPMVAPQLDDLLKIALIEKARADGINASRLSDMLGVKPWEAEALLDADAATPTADLEVALLALGTRPHLVFEAV